MTRAWGVLVGAGLVASGLVPAGATAQAADPPGSVETVVVVEETQGTPLGTGMRSFAPPAGPRTLYGTAVERDDTLPYDVTGLSASRDGSRTVAVEAGRVVVRDISGRAVRVLDGQCFADEAPALSPDGNRVAWRCARVVGPGSTASVLLTTPVAGGPVTTLTTRGFSYANERPVFLTDDLLLSGHDGDLRTVSVTGAQGPFLTRANGTRLSPRSVSVAPDGASLLFTDGRQRSVLHASLTLDGATATLADERVLATLDGFVFAPVFSRDGTSAYFHGRASAFGGADLYSVPLSGGEAVPLGPLTPDVQEGGLAVGVRESTPPAAPAVGPAELAWNGVSIPFAPATDPTASRVRVTRTAPGEQSHVTELVLPAARYRDPLHRVNGRVYSYAFQVVDRSGNVGPASVLQADASLGAYVAVNQPTSNGSASPDSFPVSFRGGTRGARYTVDYRPLGNDGTWTRWATDTTQRDAVFGSAASPGFAATTAVPGTTYYFRSRLQDPYGNSSRFALSPPAVVPLDQGVATYAGSTVTVPRAGAYGGTSTFLRAAGATASVALRGDAVQVVAEKCPTCGEVDVLVNGRVVRRVDTRLATRQARRVIWSATYPTGRTTRVALRAVGTPGRPTVVVDALAVRTWLPSPSRDLVAGQQLTRGQGLQAAGGYHRFALEPNGNLTLRTSGRLRYESGTRTGTRLVMQADGNLVLYDAASRPVWSARTARNPGSALHLQDDGNLILFRGSDGTPLFSTGR